MFKETQCLKNIHKSPPVILKEITNNLWSSLHSSQSFLSSTYSETMSNLNFVLTFFFTMHILIISKIYYLVLNVHVLYISTNF